MKALDTTTWGCRLDDRTLSPVFGSRVPSPRPKPCSSPCSHEGRTAVQACRREAHALGELHDIGVAAAAVLEQRGHGLAACRRGLDGSHRRLDLHHGAVCHGVLASCLVSYSQTLMPARSSPDADAGLHYQASRALQKHVALACQMCAERMGFRSKWGVHSVKRALRRQAFIIPVSQLSHAHAAC